MSVNPKTYFFQARFNAIEDRLTTMSNGRNEGVLLRRFCHGRYVWRISSFTSHLKPPAPTASPSPQPQTILYSEAFYSAPVLGYKMCLRCNVHVDMRGEQHLGLFLHLMQGEEDDLLAWPFQGTITFRLKHRSGSFQDVVEVMETPPGLTAFEKPSSTWCKSRNPMGFGHQEFIKVRDLCHPANGFWNETSDTIIITAHISDQHQ